MIRRWILALSPALAGAGAIAACVGSDPAPADKPPPETPPPVINVNVPPVSTTEVPPLPTELADASLPDATSNDCADGKPHDFCTTFGAPLTTEELTKLGFVKQVELADGVDLTLDSPFSPPSSLRTKLPSRNALPGTFARLVRAAAYPRNAAGRQPGVTLSFRVRISAIRREPVILATLLLGAQTEPPAFDLLSIVAVPSAEDPTIANVRLDEFVTIGAFVNHPTTIANVTLTSGVWSQVTLSVTERAADNAGAASISVDDKSDDPVLLHTKNLTPVLYTWLGLATAALADGGVWQVDYDDVMEDWAP